MRISGKIVDNKGIQVFIIQSILEMKEFKVLNGNTSWRENSLGM